MNQNDMDRGREAFVYFHNQASKYSGYSYTLDEALKIVSKGEKNIGFFTDGIGGLIREIQNDGFLSGNKVKKAMENLADKGAGKIPDRNTFFAALSSEAQDFTFREAAPVVLVESAKEIATGAQAVGDSIITTGKILTTIGPIVVVSAILYIVFYKTKQAAGK